MSETEKQTCSECRHPARAGHAASCSMQTGRAERSRERKGTVDTRLVFSALAALSVSLANFATEHAPHDANKDGEEVTSSERDLLLRQLDTVAKNIRDLPTKPPEVATETQTNNFEFGLEEVDLSQVILSQFPDKDAPPQFRILNPDASNWRDLKAGNLQEVYAATVDDLVIDADPELVHVYSPSNEGIDVVLSLTKRSFEGGVEDYALTDAEGNQLASWTLDGITPEKVQASVRQFVQREIITQLKGQDINN